MGVSQQLHNSKSQKPFVTKPLPPNNLTLHAPGKHTASQTATCLIKSYFALAQCRSSQQGRKKDLGSPETTENRRWLPHQLSKIGTKHEDEESYQARIELYVLSLYMYTCLCIYVCTCIYIYMYIHVYVCWYVGVLVCWHVGMHICMHAWMHSCHACMVACKHACMYIMHRSIQSLVSSR